MDFYISCKARGEFRMCAHTSACGGVAEETLCAIARNQRNEFEVLVTPACGVEAIFIPCYRAESKA
jgi:hypothetical protein